MFQHFHSSLKLFLLYPYDFSGGSDGKASAYNAGDPGSIPALGREDLLEKGTATHCSILASPPPKKGAQRNARASLVAQRIKHLPAMQETWVQSLGWKDPLEKEVATHSSILAWRIPWTEEPGGLQSTGSQRVRHG